MSDPPVVLFFQQQGPAARRRRLVESPSLFDLAEPAELPPTEVGPLFQVALDRYGVTHDQVARWWGISRSLVGRQIRNDDNQHLSFQRVCAFRQGDVVRDVLIDVLTRRRLVDVERRRPLVSFGVER